MNNVNSQVLQFNLADFYSIHHVIVVVITPSFPQDGGTARTAIQVHAVNLVEIRLG